MIEWGWLNIVLVSVVGVLLMVIGVSIGKRIQRHAITHDFDALIRRARSMLASGQVVQLDQFLHELTDDGPYVPSMKVLANNMIRTGHGESRSKRGRFTD
jgi:hypothetical protein